LAKDFEIHSSCDCEIGGVPARGASEIVSEEGIDSVIDCNFEILLSFDPLPSQATSIGSSPFHPGL
jgi:hypothetical protein